MAKISLEQFLMPRPVERQLLTGPQAAARVWRKSPPSLMGASRPVEKNSLTELTVKAVLQKMGVPRGPALDEAYDEVMRAAGLR